MILIITIMTVMMMILMKTIMTRRSRGIGSSRINTKDYHSEDYVLNVLVQAGYRIMKNHLYFKKILSSRIVLFVANMTLYHVQR